MKPIIIKAVVATSLICIWSRSEGQFAVTNTGVQINILQNANLYIGGDYTDISGEFNRPIELQGEIFITGSVSSVQNSVFLRKENDAYNVNFIGNAGQAISSGSNYVFIPKIVVSKGEREVAINGSVVTNNIEFVNGNINLNGTLEIYTLGTISNESTTSRILGSGIITVLAGNITNDFNYPDPHKMGISFEVSSSFNGLTINRHHQLDNNSNLNVADGITTTRYYSVSVPYERNDFDINDPDFSGPRLSSMTYSFFPVESGSLADKNLAIYFSNDDAVSWVKLPAVSAPGVTTNTNTNIALASGKTNYFVAASAECAEAFKPDAIPVINNGPTVHAPSLQNHVIKVCYGDSVSLSSDAHYYHWEHNGITNPPKAPLKFLADDLLLSGSTYTLFERTTRGCERAIQYTLDVMPLPIANFSHIPPNNTSCFLEEVQFDASMSSSERADLSLITFDWTFDDNDAISAEENPVYTFSAPGSYDAELVVGNQYGCRSVNSRVQPVVVHALPVPEFDFIDLDGDACEFEVFGLRNLSTYEDFDNTTVGAETGMTYLWEFETSATSELFEPTYDYEVFGLKTVTLIATENLTGCSASVSHDILIDPRPVPDFHFEIDGDTDVEGIAEGVCEGIDILFANESEISDDSPLSHFWTFGDGSTSTDQSPSRHFAKEGTYLVTLEVSSDTHGCVHSLSKEIAIHPAAEGHFEMKAGTKTISDICAGDEVLLNNNTFIPGDGPIEYSWDLGDGSFSTETSPVHDFSEPRMHLIKLQRTSEFGCVNTVSRQLQVHAYPIADFKVDNKCEGQILDFRNTSYVTGGQLETFDWQFGDGNSSSEKDLGHLYEEYGDYSVSLTVTSDASCASSVSKQVTVYRNPEVVLPSFVLSCSGSTELNALNAPDDYPGVAGVYTWLDKNGSVLGNMTTVEVSSSGMYYLDVSTAAPANCEASYSVPVFIVEPGVLGPDRVVCEQTELDAGPISGPTQGNLSYSWKQNGELLSTSSSSKLMVTESGDYEVTVSFTLPTLVSQPSCSYTDVVHVDVDLPPPVDLQESVTICQGNIVALESNVTADSYEWTNLTTGLQVGSASSLEVSEAGDYRLKVLQGTCSSSDVITVEVLTLPEVSFEVSDDEPCPGEDISFTNLSFTLSPDDELVSYNWNFGDGTGSTTANAHKSYSLPGSYNVVLTATSQNGCVATYEDVIEVSPVPSASFVAANSCEKTVIVFANTSSISDESFLSYTWDFGDGTVSNQVSPEKTYLQAGSYAVTLLARSAKGCQTNTTQQVEVYPSPTGSFAIEAGGEVVESICSAENVIFRNQSHLPGGDPIEFFWDFGNGTTSVEESPQIAFDEPGLYTITLVRTTENGCENSVMRQLRVDPKPTAAFSGADVCQGNIVSFLNTSELSVGSIETYEWDLGDGNISFLENPQHTYDSYGEYDVKLTVSTLANCIAELSQTVKVFRPPSFDIGEYGLSVTGSLLLDPAADPDRYIPVGTNFLWKNPSGQVISTEASVEIFTSGNYTVIAETIAPEMCKVTYSIPAFILEPGELGSAISVCQETELNATPGSFPSAGTLMYSWSKDGELLDSTGSKLTVNETGTYEVTVTYALEDIATQPSAAYTDQIFVIANEPAALELGESVSICEGNTVVLTSNVVGDSYKWTNSETDEILGTSSSLEVSEGGDYQLNVTTGSCSASDIVSVKILSPPEAGFLLSDNRICEGEDIVFTDISFSLYPEDPVVSYLWDFGDGTTSSGPDASKLFTAAGSYSVSLFVTTQKGCSASFEREIVVDAPPDITFTASDSCEGEEITFRTVSDESAEIEYSWDFGDDSYSAAAEPTHIFAEPGLYTVSLVANSGSCQSSYSYEVKIYPKPSLDLGEQIATCGDQLVIDAGADMASYRWYEVSSGTTLSTERLFIATENGELGVEVSSHNGCTIRDETTIVLNSPITINLGADRTVCGPITLDAGAFPGVQQVWSNGVSGRFLEVTESGTYRVSVTDQNGCTAQDEVTITVIQQPTLDLGEDIAMCRGETVLLDAGNPGASYQWSTGETTRTIEVNETGTFQVEVSNGNCKTDETIEVLINSPPSVDFTHSGDCTNDAIRFLYTGTSNNLTYFWSFGDGTFSTKAQPQKSYSTSQLFEVTLSVKNAEGCSAELTQAITVHPLPVPDFTFSSLCEDNDVLFFNQTFYSGDGDLTYYWDFGEGSTSTDENPVFVYTEPGSYVVRLTVKNEWNCSQIVTKTLTVRPTPVVDLENHLTTCESSIHLDAQNAGSSFVWSDNSDKQQLTVTESGIYTVKVTSPEGCVAYGTTEVEILEQERPHLGDYVEACGEVYLNPMVNSSAYQWSNGSTSAEIIAKKSGIYWVQTISENLCINRDSVEVVVNPIPTFSLGPDLERCEGVSIKLEAKSPYADAYLWTDNSTSSSINVTRSGKIGATLTTSKGCEYSDEISVTFHKLPAPPLQEQYDGCEQLTLDALNAGDSYLWSSGAISQTLGVTESGEYWVKITNVNGCSTTDYSFVNIDPVPQLELGNDFNICAGKSVEVDAGNSGAHHIWSTGETTRQISVNESGTYGVQVSYGNCVASDKVTIAVKDLPEASFSYDGKCAEESVKFHIEGEIPGFDYVWSFGDGTKSVSTAPQKVFTAASSYAVSLQVTDKNGCSSTQTEYISIYPTPRSNFSFNNACEGSKVQFANNTTYAEQDQLSYYWEFGDGNTSTVENPQHDYLQAGPIDVRLTVVSESACIDSKQKILTVYQSPDVDLGNDLEICETSVVLDAGNSEGTYRWSNNSNSQTLVVTESGEYNVRVTNGVGCVSRDTVQVTFIEHDIPALADTEGCGEVVLDPAVNDGSYLWSTGDTEPTITVFETDTYWVQTVSPGLCINRDTAIIVVNQVPVFDLGDDKEACEGDRVFLEAKSDVVATVWWNNNSSATSLEIWESGSYSAKLTSEEGCEFSDEVTVTFNELPIVALAEDYVACNALTLQANNPGSTFLWSTGSTEPEIEVLESGDYWLEVTNENGCSISNSAYVTINPLPNPNLGKDLEICFGQTVTVDAGLFSTYKWNNISGQRFKDIGMSGNYVVSVANEWGCEATDEIVVTVRAPIGLELGPDQFLCSPEEFIIDAGVNAEQYTWSSSNGFFSNEKVITPGRADTYSLTVSDGFGCSEEDVIHVLETTEQIEASFLIPSIVGLGESVNFIQLTDPAPIIYEWFFGNGRSTTQTANPTYTYPEPGDYEVSLMVSNGICSDTETKLLSVVNGTEIEGEQAKVNFVEFQKTNLFPNPTNAFVNLDVELSSEEDVNIQVYDLSGLQVASHQFSGLAELIQFDLSQVLPGTYILRIQAGSNIKTIRFVKLL